MKIVIATDSYKGNLSSLKVAEYIEVGIKKASNDIEVIKVPIADGGEGTIDAFLASEGGSYVETDITGPLMEKTRSQYAILKNRKTAVIETALSAGLTMIPFDKRNPLKTTTYGLGQMILSALDNNCDEIIIGLGGSGTNDGGAGMAYALGVKFFDNEGREFLPTGGSLCDISKIDFTHLDTRIKRTKITGACDVTNPLYGINGAAYVYAPQKGANSEQVKLLDLGLKNFSMKAAESTGQRLEDIPGSGAAGGLGAGLMVFLNASLKKGIDVITEVCHLKEKIKGADLVITGEGKTDFQTAFGKVPVGVASIAKSYGIPVICLSGGLGEGYEDIYEKGVDAAFSNVIDAMSLDKAMENSGDYLIKFAYGLTRLLISFKKRT